MTLVPTEELDDPLVATRLSELFGQPFRMLDRRMNVCGTTDSDMDTLRY